MPLDHIDLKEMKRSGDIEGLLCILDTGDTNEMGEAIRMLGELRSRKAIRPLVGLLEKDDIQVRANSAWALGEIGEAKAVLPLIGLLNDPSENVRVYAAWALGKIGDKRAISALNASIKNGSQELRKQAKEAIARIESSRHNRRKGDDDNGSGEDELPSSEIVEIPLVTLDVPMELFECDYVSKVEGESRSGNTMGFSGDVSIQDTVNANQENTRKIIMGLKNDFHGLVSIDILFKYIDNDGGEKTSSVWLQMESLNSGSPQDAGRELGPAQIEGGRKRAIRQVFKKARIKPARKQVYRPVEYEIPDFRQEEEPQIEEQIPSEEPVSEDIPEKKTAKKRGSSRRKQAPLPEPGIPGDEQVLEQPGELDISDEEIPGEKIPEKPQAIAELPAQEAKPAVAPQPAVIDKIPAAPPVQVAVAPPVQQVQPAPTPQGPKIDKPPASPPVQAVTPAAPPPAPVVDTPPAPAPSPKTGTSVDSAVRLLSDIGMTGMTEAASTVTQLGGQEAESLQSRLRTLPVDQIPDELVNLGDYIASVDVRLHGKGDSGEMKGEMQMYFPKSVALDIANELLCNGPDAAVKEFTDDIISTLKETANIFGGQYVSAISEYIEIPIYLEAPSFMAGASVQIAESLMKEIAGKVEFVLATDIAFGNGKSGRLIMLLDPKSYDIIITKLF